MFGGFMSKVTQPKSPRDVVIVDGVRTPFAKADTKLKTVHPAELGRIALKELIARTNLDTKLVDEVIIGNTGSPSDAVNISRVVALNAGVPQRVSAHTVHRNCASALESISEAFDKIRSGMADVVLSGGTESMSQMPLIYSAEVTRAIGGLASAKSPVQQVQALAGLIGADLKSIMGMMTTSPMSKAPYKPRIAIVEGLTDPFVGKNMGDTAELLAKEWSLSRLDQDKFALLSHQKAVAAQKNGIMAQEITPVFLPPSYKEVVEMDIGPRDGQSMEALGKLKPIFDRKNGTVTAGNSCPITDGAAMVLVMSREKAEALGYKPMARILSYAFAGLEPERMGLGPVYSSPIALRRAGLTLADMDYYELNEAFAAQVLACAAAFESDKFAKEKLDLPKAVGRLDMDKLNVNGGAIALGHPVGTTGTRLVLTLMKQLKRSGKELGLATLCIGGGQGGAMVIKNEG
jgi:acetyl-CoA acyltransferase